MHRTALHPGPLCGLVLGLVLGLVHLVGAPPPVGAGEAETRQGKVPKGKELRELVHAYLDADFGERARMRASWDKAYAPLDPKVLPKLRKELLKIAQKYGPKLQPSGTANFYEGVEGKQGPGKYIVSGKPKTALFISLHGGGAGSGTATTYMGGGGFGWIYPQVLQATEHGWTDAGTEEFVMELIEAAKRTWKIDPNHIYLTGHSMGGYGTWTLGSRHADVFGGLAAYAGAPSCIGKPGGAKEEYIAVSPGVLPNLYNIPLHFYQSGDDTNVYPQANDLAHRALQDIKKQFPDGFNFRYDRVEGRAHAAPEEGYLPSQKWVASHARVPRPRRFLWQPVLSWKRHFYWAYWARAELEATLEFRAGTDNVIEIETHAGSGDVSGLSILLGAPLVDLGKPVTIKVNGEQRFQGLVAPTFSTLLLTLPRNDDDLLFDARVDL
jgi:predicted esterase